MCVFFFSSRRRHTRFDCDWSSDVCSSDLLQTGTLNADPFFEYAYNYDGNYQGIGGSAYTQDKFQLHQRSFESNSVTNFMRSEERRVGKSVDLGGRRIIKKKKKNIHTYIEH